MKVFMKWQLYVGFVDIGGVRVRGDHVRDGRQVSLVGGAIPPEKNGYYELQWWAGVQILVVENYFNWVSNAWRNIIFFLIMREQDL